MSVGDFLTFLFPALQFIQFQLGGVLYATDICLMVSLPILLATNVRHLRDKPVPTFIFLGFLWLMAQILSDALNRTPEEDYLRGWSKILLTTTHFITLALLIRRSRKRLLLYGVGWVTGGILTFFFSPGAYAAGNEWKFGVGLYITTLTCLLAGSITSIKTPTRIAILVSIGLINVILGFRTLGVVCAASAIFTYVATKEVAGSAPRSGVPIFKLGFLLALGVWAIQGAYSTSASAGLLGDAAQAKYEEQSSGEGGVLLGGRSEFLASSQAIVDAPILGHGSWAKDPKYGNMLLERRAELGYKNFGETWGDDLIPTHSHLLGAWVEAGFIGALFWLWILYLVIDALRRTVGDEPLIPFIAFVSVSLLWDIIFSPYGADRRFTTTYFIYAVALFSRWTTESRARAAC